MGVVLHAAYYSVWFYILVYNRSEGPKSTILFVRGSEVLQYCLLSTCAYPS